MKRKLDDLFIIIYYFICLYKKINKYLCVVLLVSDLREWYKKNRIL